MSINEKKILSDLTTMLDKKKELNVDTLVLYSLLSTHTQDIDEVLEISDDHVLKIEAKDLKKLMLNFKISNNILSQMIKSNIDKESFEEITKEYNLNLEFENINESKIPPLRSLIGYNNLLKEKDFLIDDCLINFLEYLEKGQADNASLKFEDLSEIQKKSIPLDIQDWIQSNTLYC